MRTPGSERRARRRELGRAIGIHARDARCGVSTARFHLGSLMDASTDRQQTPLKALEKRLEAVYDELDAIDREVASCTGVARRRRKETTT